MAMIKEKKLIMRWGDGKPLIHKGESYTVHKMSYGDFFLEPSKMTPREKKRYYGETKPFHPRTKWLGLADAKKRLYEVM